MNTARTYPLYYLRNARDGGGDDIEISYLNNLADNATQIYMSSLNLSKLPNLLRFSNLEYLHCANNNLTQLPHNLAEILPNLRDFHCGNNMLSTLPILGNKVKYIYCSNNNITHLPPLSPKLKILNCTMNRIVELPELPPHLTDLVCYYNDLTVLPELPASLKKLYCGNNMLSKLPKLPKKMKILSCYSNRLDYLPRLPYRLNILICNNNNLTAIPPLGLNISGINFEHNPIHDIANCNDEVEVAMRLDVHIEGAARVNAAIVLDRNPDMHFNDGDVTDSDIDYYDTLKLSMIRTMLYKINRFRKFYYLNKFKSRFRYILWVKIREPKIMEKYSPNKLIELLNEKEDDDFDDFDSLFK